MTTKLNREQRRAQAHQRPVKVRRQHAADLTPLYILDNARPHAPEEKAGTILKHLATFDRMRAGQGDKADFDEIAMVINICKVRAMNIDATLADMLERAQDAMIATQDRYERLGRWVFDGPGLTAVTDAMEACQAIIEASSPLQMRNAKRAVVDAIAGKQARMQMQRAGLC